MTGREYTATNNIDSIRFRDVNRERFLPPEFARSSTVICDQTAPLKHRRRVNIRFPCAGIPVGSLNLPYVCVCVWVCYMRRSCSTILLLLLLFSGIYVYYITCTRVSVRRIKRFRYPRRACIVYNNNNNNILCQVPVVFD